MHDAMTVTRCSTPASPGWSACSRDLIKQYLALDDTESDDGSMKSSNNKAKSNSIYSYSASNDLTPSDDEISYFESILSLTPFDESEFNTFEDYEDALYNSMLECKKSEPESDRRNKTLPSRLSTSNRNAFGACQSVEFTKTSRFDSNTLPRYFQKSDIKPRYTLGNREFSSAHLYPVQSRIPIPRNTTKVSYEK